jgi:hypothetical protein
MRHFFFDHSDDGSLTRDEAGLDFGTLEEAQKEAVRALAEYGRELFPGSLRRELAVSVREGEQLLFQASIDFRAGAVAPDVK